jgi:hypothetical protein
LSRHIPEPTETASIEASGKAVERLAAQIEVSREHTLGLRPMR